METRGFAFRDCIGSNGPGDVRSFAKEVTLWAAKTQKKLGSVTAPWLNDTDNRGQGGSRGHQTVPTL